MTKQQKTGIVVVSGMAAGMLMAVNSTGLSIWPRALMVAIVAALVVTVVRFSLDSRKLW